METSRLARSLDVALSRPAFVSKALEGASNLCPLFGLGLRGLTGH